MPRAAFVRYCLLEAVVAFLLSFVFWGSRGFGGTVRMQCSGDVDRGVSLGLKLRVACVRHSFID